MSLNEILGQDLHSMEVIQKIAAFQNQLAVKGLSKSSAYCKSLSNLLIECAEKYCSKLCDDQLAAIKADNLYNLKSLDKYCNEINEEMNLLKDKYFQVLKIKITKMLPANEDTNKRILEKLRFTEIFDDKIQTILIKFQYDYKIYSVQQIQEQSAIELASNANKIAVEANYIAKSNRRIAWLSIVIALCSLGVAAIATYLTYLK